MPGRPRHAAQPLIATRYRAHRTHARSEDGIRPCQQILFMRRFEAANVRALRQLNVTAETTCSGPWYQYFRKKMLLCLAAAQVTSFVSRREPKEVTYLGGGPIRPHR